MVEVNEGRQVGGGSVSGRGMMRKEREYTEPEIRLVINR